MKEAYEKELAEMKLKMETAEAFAEKFPMFKEKILREKLTGESAKLGDRYKDIHFAWGINRYFYETSKNITNFSGQYNGYLFNIYINSLVLYDLHENFGLIDAISENSYFYFDKMNTTFYIKDEQIADFLEEINDWYVSAKKKAKAHHDKVKKDNLLKQLKELKDAE